MSWQQVTLGMKEEKPQMGVRVRRPFLGITYIVPSSVVQQWSSLEELAMAATRYYAFGVGVRIGEVIETRAGTYSLRCVVRDHRRLEQVTLTGNED